MATKKGMASLFLAAFMTLLIGIVILSFLQIVMTELRAASNNDLSQSAYDAALAGIEDAKTAIVKYQTCQAKNNEPEGCAEFVAAMEQGMDAGSCTVVSDALGRTDNGEVLVQAGDGDDERNDLDEAYTCLKVSTTSAEYNSYLSSSNTSRIVPVVTAGEEYNNVVGVKFEWFSENAAEWQEDLAPTELAAKNDQIFSNVYTTLENSNVYRFDTIDNVLGTYPVVTFDLFQSDPTFRAYEFDVNNETNTGTNHAMLTFYPENTKNGNSGTYVTARNVLDNSDKESTGPISATCGYTEGSRCRTVIRFPATYGQDTTEYQLGSIRSKSTFFFRVTLPYGAPSTDFKITLCSVITDDGECTEIINFNGVQAVVDSTGRASTLYRRVVAHIDLLNSGSLPEFAIQQYNGGDPEKLQKSFYVTKDCWAGKSGNLTSCHNSGN